MSAAASATDRSSCNASARSSHMAASRRARSRSSAIPTRMSGSCEEEVGAEGAGERGVAVGVGVGVPAEAARAVSLEPLAVARWPSPSTTRASRWVSTWLAHRRRSRARSPRRPARRARGCPRRGAARCAARGGRPRSTRSGRRSRRAHMRRTAPACPVGTDPSPARRGRDPSNLTPTLAQVGSRYRRLRSGPRRATPSRPRKRTYLAHRARRMATSSGLAHTWRVQHQKDVTRPLPEGVRPACRCEWVGCRAAGRAAFRSGVRGRPGRRRSRANGGGRPGRRRGARPTAARG